VGQFFRRRKITFYNRLTPGFLRVNIFCIKVNGKADGAIRPALLLFSGVTGAAPGCKFLHLLKGPLNNENAALFPIYCALRDVCLTAV